MLGVDMIRLGWDSPPTEVGIYLAPTKSGVVATQELGRILRTSPETGKDFAIAIQMVDRYLYRGQAPVLIPNIFEPHFVAQGTILEKKPSEELPRESSKRFAPVTFSGMDIEAIIKETFNSDLLGGEFRDLPVDKMSKVLKEVADEAERNRPGAPLIEIYRHLAREIPRIGRDKQMDAFQTSLSDDPKRAREGKNVLIMTSLRTILNSIEKYFGGDEGLNSELIHSAIARVLENLPKFRTTISLQQSIYLSAAEGAMAYLSEALRVPKAWVERDTYKMMIRACGEFLAEHPFEINKDLLEEAAAELARKTGESKQLIIYYLKYQYALREQVETIEPGVFRAVSEIIMEEDIREVILTLTPREQKVLTLRAWGFPDGREGTLENVGKELNVTRERIRQIEAKALRKLRHPRRSKKFQDYLYEEEERPINFPEIPRDFRFKTLDYDRPRRISIQRPEKKEAVPFDGPWERWLKFWQIDIKKVSVYLVENIYREFHSATQYILWSEWLKLCPLPENADEREKNIRFKEYLKANDKKRVELGADLSEMELPEWIKRIESIIE